jgi:hypothetical protein
MFATVHVLAKPADRRACYEWKYRLDGGKTWVTVPSTLQEKTTVNGLPVATNVASVRRDDEKGHGRLERSGLDPREVA